MSAILKSRSEIDAAIRWIDKHGFTRHECEPKNWDLANVLPHIRDGNLLDMGCTGSFVLPNVHRIWYGDHWGCDIAPCFDPVQGCNYIQASLTSIPAGDGYFQYITCLSVIEHGVDHVEFLKEASRLLCKGGQLFVTFDYFDPPPPPSEVNGFPWRILGFEDAIGLRKSGPEFGLLPDEMTTDFTSPEGVINPSYWSPNDYHYSFGYVRFTKQ